MALPTEPKGSRKDTLATVAIDMMQTRGFSALGLRDLAQAASIRASSLYNHFASKEELACEAMSLYAARQQSDLSALAGTGSECLHTYAELFARILRDEHRLCLALILAVERNALPPEILTEIGRFVEQNTTWLASAWNLGLSDGTIESVLSGEAAGPLIFGSLEGLMAFSLLKKKPAAAFLEQASLLFTGLGVRSRA
jgi:TetR/AcrR family transcriptional repressor of nem operon